MSCDIDEIDTISERSREALAARGVINTNQLLKYCADAGGRAEFARMTGLKEADLRAWAAMAELLRLPNLGKGSLNLLAAAGVRSLEDMRLQEVEPLLARLAEAKRRSRNPQKVRLPSVGMVEGWIAHAGQTVSSIN